MQETVAVSERSAEKRRILAWTGWLLVAALLCLVAWTAWNKAVGNQPEWYYWTKAASFQDERSLEGMLHGYSPGLGFFLRPFFVLPGRTGVALYIAIALACAATLWITLNREIHPANGPPWEAPWRLVWFSAPLYLTLQNNQIMMQVVTLAVLGLVALRRKRRIVGSFLLGLSVAIKPLFLPLGLFLLLKTRWKSAVLFGFFSVLISVLATASYLGWDLAFDLHVEWPAGVLGMDPARVLTAPTAPPEFRENQAVVAWVISSGPFIGESVALALRYLVSYGTLLPVVWFTLKRSRSGDLGWEEIALWMSWTSLALPHGRYYYCLLLLPAWVIFSRRRPGADAGWWTRWAIRIGWSLPVFAWGMRSDGWYAAASALTFVLMLDHGIRSSAPAALARRASTRELDEAIPEPSFRT